MVERRLDFFLFAIFFGVRYVEAIAITESVLYTVRFFSTWPSPQCLPVPFEFFVKCGGPLVGNPNSKGGIPVVNDDDESLGLATCNPLPLDTPDYNPEVDGIILRCVDTSPHLLLGTATSEAVVKCTANRNSDSLEDDLKLVAAVTDAVPSCSGNTNLLPENFVRRFFIETICGDNIFNYVDQLCIGNGVDPISCSSSSFCGGSILGFPPCDESFALPLITAISSPPSESELCPRVKDTTENLDFATVTKKATYSVTLYIGQGESTVYTESFCRLSTPSYITVSCLDGGVIGFDETVEPYCQKSDGNSRIDCDYDFSPIDTGAINVEITCSGTMASKLAISVKFNPVQMLCTDVGKYSEYSLGVRYEVSVAQKCNTIPDYSDIAATYRQVCSPRTGTTVGDGRYDYNNDGIPDTPGFDIDGNGIPDVIQYCSVQITSCTGTGPCREDGSYELGPIISTIPYENIELMCLETVQTSFCFSGNMMVQVKDLEEGNVSLVSMQYLNIGDTIRVGQGDEDYSRVYSFGHYDTDSRVEFLQLHHVEDQESPLEITKDHMLHVSNRGFVPASTVTIGEELVLAGDETKKSKVTKIGLVNRKGAFAPFTDSGTIVVNRVVASNYVFIKPSYQEYDASNGGFLGVNHISMQWIAHSAQSTHRLICKMSKVFCESENYSETGISNWVYLPYMVSQWLVSRHKIILFVAVVPLTLLFAALSNFIESVVLGKFSVVLLAMIVLFTFLMRWNKSTKIVKAL